MDTATSELKVENTNSVAMYVYVHNKETCIFIACLCDYMHAPINVGKNLKLCMHMSLSASRVYQAAFSCNIFFHFHQPRTCIAITTQIFNI